LKQEHTSKRSKEADKRNNKFQYKAILPRLVKFRENIGLNKSAMAERIEVEVRAYGFYELGRRKLPPDALVALSRLGLNLNWLFTGEEKMLRLAEDAIAGFPEKHVIRGTVVAHRALGNGRVTPEDMGILVSTAAELLSLGYSEDAALEEINPAARAYIKRESAHRPPPGPIADSAGT
jgi:transcriptional regulator with XRE-family HTH domain